MGSIAHDGLDPPCKLNRAARIEYDRLLDVLKSGGVLERVDLNCVANAAKIKALLDRAHKDLGRSLDPIKLGAVLKLTTQHRGLLRDLGLTSQPSRTIFRGKPAGSERDNNESPWVGKLKVS